MWGSWTNDEITLPRIRCHQITMRSCGFIKNMILIRSDYGCCMLVPSRPRPHTLPHNSSTDRKFASTHHIKRFDKHLKARFGAARQALCSLIMLIQCVSICPAEWQFTRLCNREKGGKRRTLQLESINLPRCFPLNEHQMCEWFDNGRSAYNRPAAFLL